MNLLELFHIQTKILTKEAVELTMEIKEDHQQPFGIMHGGINGILIETACSMGANEQLDTGFAVGVDLNVNHLRSVTTGNLTVRATPDHIGRTMHVWQAVIYDEQQRKIAVGRCTLTVRNS